MINFAPKISDVIIRPLFQVTLVMMEVLDSQELMVMKALKAMLVSWVRLDQRDLRGMLEYKGSLVTVVSTSKETKEMW